MDFKLNREEREWIMQGFMERLYLEFSDDLQLVTPTRAAAILNVSPQTVLNLTDLPRVTITQKNICYKLSDLRDWIEKHRS